MTRPVAATTSSAPVSARAEFAEGVRRGLASTPKQLEPQYFYDELGSCLFEAITRLPWYRITRAERELLRAHGPVVGAMLGGAPRVVELGAGNGEKLEILVRALRPGPRIRVHLIDVSDTALERCQRMLAGYPEVSTVAHRTTYEAGLARVATTAGSGRTLVLFLGSNIGNLHPPQARAFLAAIRAALRPGDLLLLGTDLVKPAAELLRAYDDPLGVTAAFNKNLLVRINRELGGTFDPAAFDHRATWNRTASRVEMHLVSRRSQTVDIPVAGGRIGFEPGETIWTESSYKYEPIVVRTMGAEAGFRDVRQWIDAEARFALTLFRAAP